MKKLHALFICLIASSLVSCSTTPERPQAVMSSAVPRIAHPVASVPESMSADPQLAQLERLAPDADPGVLALALEARSCALKSGEVGDDARLAVIDYSRPSSSKRLWVFDLGRNRLLFNELVAHGQGSGDNYATRFSNLDNSHETSLGLYVTAETYIGNNGYSLRLDGKDRGFNDNARSRAIVMHGAWYVDPGMVASRGRIGRSHGCPALGQGIAHQVIDTLKGRQLLFSYANDAAWLQNGQSFACDGRSAREIITAARAPRGMGGSPMVASAAR